ncbi:MAG: F0F1 ATP synthase subunit delta [Thiomicrospira sp.]|jgi:F-type H+-transporting ATPase subunit delta|nr:F0F1 ATP synthase subunit delta [Thiomicrospira sp.]
MAELITTARPYAEAAFSFAKESKQLVAWSEMLQHMALIATDEKMAALIANPRYTLEQKISVFEGVMGSSLTAEGKNLLVALAENGRLNALGHVSALFEQRKAVEDKRVKATVTSALATTVEQQSKLSAALNAKFNAEVDISYEVDASLISGIRIKVGDWVVDNTAVTQLQKLGAAIAH